MATDATTLEALRRVIRIRALTNVTLLLDAQARRSAGRLAVRVVQRDTLVIELRDVRTLVRVQTGFELAHRDFALLVGVPTLWPFERQAALQPFVLAPADFAAPNSDGRGFCLELAGIPPERLARVLYDNVRLRQFRLDHCVDWQAAAFVRSRLERFPADRRRLLLDEDER